MKHFISPLRLLLLLLTAATVVATSACSVLTESQLKAVQKLSIAADTITYSPTQMFLNLSEIRKERGIFYAASITSTSIHENELYETASAYTQDIKMATKMQAYSNILNSYIRALKSLSSPSRYENIGREIRGIGRNIDSIIIRYNQLELDDQIPTGFAKISGKYAAYTLNSNESPSNIISDRKYTDLVIHLYDTEQIRKKCTSGLNAFKRAHHKTN